jgi:small-conductance mechanosensitive channel
VPRSIRALTSLALALCLAFGLLAPGALAAEDEGAINYTQESEAAFQQQLNARKIHSAIINKRLRSVRITLNDGTHVLAKYPKHQEPQTVARLKAHGATVTVLAKKQAEKEAGKKKGKKHHKIRYIVGAVLIVVILLVGGVLLYRRRAGRD